MNRTLVWQIMWRYLRGKRKANAVPLLSRISMIAIGVAACAMIILLSVFNGLGGVIKDTYNAFYPDVRIVPQKGKFFAFTEQQLQSIKTTKGVQQITPTIEDNVLMNNEGNDNQVIVLKGVDNNYFSVNDIAPFITQGKKTLINSGEPQAIVGNLIMDRMGMDLNMGMNTLTLYYPNVNATNPAANPLSAFNSLILLPSGVFEGMAEFDEKYILTPLPLAQQLLQAEGKYSALEIKVQNDADAEEVKEALQKITGNAYRVETRYEQNRTVYTVILVEKWAMYAILVLVLIIASFNMIGALSLLAMEKEKDVAILKAMGADNSTIRSIFIGEGVLWSMIGGLAGLIAGLIICLLQMQFGIVKLSGFVIQAYPVLLEFTDFILILITIFLTGLLASWRPSQKAAKQAMPGLKS
jgi:lipoprotein-releasing system permease protein